METFRGLKSGLHGFCSSTSIHGLRYVGDDATTVTSRCAWIVAVTLSFFGAGWLIADSIAGFYCCRTFPDRVTHGQGDQMRL
jgi:hypothetical protein